MTKNEAVKVLKFLQISYPRYYEGVDDETKQSMVVLWAEMFDEPFDVVAAAVKSFVATDSKGFPPVIGQIKEKIRLLTKSNDEISESEAWGYVSKALRNSAYGSAEEFQKLPTAVKKLVGTPSQLKEWSMMDADTVQSVVASNFQRSFRCTEKRDAEIKALPSDVRRLVSSFSASTLKSLPETEEQEIQRRKQENIAKLCGYVNGERMPDADELAAVKRMMEE